MTQSSRCAVLVAFFSAALATNALAASYAVIVGISDYPSGADLPYATSDADDFEAALRADAVRWPEENVTTLKDGAASLAEIQLAVEDMQTGSAEDTCVFYFSGRGSQVANVAEADGFDEAIDADNGSVTDDTLATWLAGFTNESVLVVIEASYAGGMIDGPPGANTVAILSCGEAEIAVNDNASLSNATFTYNFVRALRHYAVDADDSDTYSAQEAFAAVPPLGSQTPVLLDGMGSDLELRCLWQGHAVLVGISDYPGSSSDLSYCAKDAEDFSAVLHQDAKHWDLSRTTLLVNGQARFATIKTAILDAKDDADVFVFFYSGHGTQDPFTLVPPGESDPRPFDESSDEALVAYDYDILDDHLEQWFSQFRSDEICLLIDSCFSGGIAKSLDGGAEAWAREFAADLVSKGDAALKSAKDLDDGTQNGLVAIMASDDDQSSMEDDSLQNGVFTYFVVEAMCTLAADQDANGYLSAEETYAYAGPLAQQFWGGQVAQIFPDDTGSFDILAAADRERPSSGGLYEDLPFGGADGFEGCVARTSSGRAGVWGCVMALLAAACVVSRRRSVLVAASTLLIAGGCGEYGNYDGQYQGQYEVAPNSPYPPPALEEQGAPVGVAAQPLSPQLARYYVWTARGFIETRPDARIQPAPTYYVWTEQGFVTANPQPQPAAPVAAAAPPVSHPQQLPQPVPGGPPAELQYAGVPGGQPFMRARPDLEDEAPSRRPRFCPRIGIMQPVGAKTQDYIGGPGPGFGMSGRLLLINFDVGVGIYIIEGVDVNVTALLTYLYADLVLPFARGKSVEIFASAGPRIIMAQSGRGGLDSSNLTEEMVGSVGIAGGIRRPQKGWELKLTYDSLLGSENVQGLVGGHFAWRF